jgi:hypothetical protein
VVESIHHLPGGLRPMVVQTRASALLKPRRDEFASTTRGGCQAHTMCK